MPLRSHRGGMSGRRLHGVRRSAERSPPPAMVVRRAEALLRGGVPASRVWGLIAAEHPRDPVLLELARRLSPGGAPGRPRQEGRTAGSSRAAGSGRARAAGLGPGRAVHDDQAWRVLIAAWELAAETGAPSARALERLADALTALDALAERRSVLLAAPRATVRLVALLPPASLLLGVVLGFDPFPVLLTPFGAILVLSGFGLLGAGIAWAAAQTATVERADRVEGWACELAWIALGGGLPPPVALRAVAEAADAAGADWVRLGELRRDGAVAAVLAVAAGTGAPAGALLLAEAAAARARAQAELERAAERLGVRVLLPLGVCVLPSFVLLGVLPVLLTMLGGVAGELTP